MNRTRPRNDGNGSGERVAGQIKECCKKEEDVRRWRRCREDSALKRRMIMKGAGTQEAPQGQKSFSQTQNEGVGERDKVL